MVHKNFDINQIGAPSGKNLHAGCDTSRAGGRFTVEYFRTPKGNGEQQLSHTFRTRTNARPDRMVSQNLTGERTLRLTTSRRFLSHIRGIISQAHKEEYSCKPRDG